MPAHIVSAQQHARVAPAPVAASRAQRRAPDIATARAASRARHRDCERSVALDIVIALGRA
jgi:hypothetical protein